MSGKAVETLQPYQGVPLPTRFVFLFPCSEGGEELNVRLLATTWNLALVGE